MDGIAAEEKRMELLQLRYFQAVARHEHISRAAAQLQVAQPSLSRTLARLERDLGVPLLDRQGRRVRLNRFGAAFLRHVDRALQELDDGRRELADAAGLERGTVAVAVETLLTLAPLLAGFIAAHPGIRLRIYQSTAEAMLRQLRAGEVDLCVASQPLAGAALRTIDVFQEEVLLAVPPAHPLARRRRVTPDQLAGQPFVTTRRGHWQRALADRLFADAGVEPAVVCEGDEPAAVRPLVSAGLGVGLLPEVSRRTTDHPPVAWLHLDAPDCHRTLRLVWREDAYLSAAAQRFRDVAAQQLRAMAGDTPSASS
jgi:DNA-binding transcriptional LysR family regulator